MGRRLPLLLLALFQIWPIAFGQTAGIEEQLRKARDLQQLEQLSDLADRLTREARKSKQPNALYLAALARSYQAQVYLETGRKPDSAETALAGMDLAELAVAGRQDSAEFHRLLGTLCGQIIPADPWKGIGYARCAKEEIDLALKLDPELALAWVSRGVGLYYLPPAFGGGPEKAELDFRKALRLDADLGEAYLWLGMSLRKQNRMAEARRALEAAGKRMPDSQWLKKQLESLPR
jgi:lipoprotein NlpI